MSPLWGFGRGDFDDMGSPFILGAHAPSSMMAPLWGFGRDNSEVASWPFILGAHAPSSMMSPLWGSYTNGNDTPIGAHAGASRTKTLHMRRGLARDVPRDRIVHSAMETRARSRGSFFAPSPRRALEISFFWGLAPQGRHHKARGVNPGRRSDAVPGRRSHDSNAFMLMHSDDVSSPNRGGIIKPGV
jgi:hypothetical protein